MKVYFWATAEIYERVVATTLQYRISVYGLITVLLSHWSEQLQSELDTRKTSSNDDIQLTLALLDYVEKVIPTSSYAFFGHFYSMPVCLQRLAAAAAIRFFEKNVLSGLYLRGASKDASGLELIRRMHDLGTQKYAAIEVQVPVFMREWSEVFEFVRLLRASHQAIMTLYNQYNTQWSACDLYTSAVEGKADAFWSDRHNDLIEIPESIIYCNVPSAKSHATVFLSCPSPLETAVPELEGLPVSPAYLRFLESQTPI